MLYDISSLIYLSTSITQGRGYSLRKQNENPAVASSSMDSVIKSYSQACPEALSNFPSAKKQKMCDFQTKTITISANGGSEHNILGMGHLNVIYSINKCEVAISDIMLDPVDLKSSILVTKATIITVHSH